MKIGPSGFCMPVSIGCTVLKREAVLKVPNPSGVLTTTATTDNFLHNLLTGRGCSNFRHSSACTTKRFPLPWCASATKIVCPLQPVGKFIQS
jgi:hypothetical protein